jgi:zinc transport system substrate-binding protein
VLQVATGLFPLAQAVEAIGQNKVSVTDVVPAGSDPFTYQPTPAQRATLENAALVVTMGGGFQPAIEAINASHQLQLAPALKVSDAYVWLDPETMTLAVAKLASAMEKADPAAAPLFRNGAQAFSDEVNSTGIDFENTLSTCGRDTFATADGAFTVMARSYGVKNLVLGASADPTSTEVGSAADQASAAGVNTVFREPWLPTATVTEVAARLSVSIRTLDTLAGAPAGGFPNGANYINLMEANLGALSKALGCQ